jgi:predicted ester cyclase
MVTDWNKDLVRELYAKLMGEGDVATAERLLAADYVDHDVPGLQGDGDRDDLIRAVQGVRAAFPDIKPELYELVAEGDWVAVRVEASGHHNGTAFMGIAPSGTSMRWRELHLFRCANRHIVEHRGIYDMLAILQQLGAVPSA